MDPRVTVFCEYLGLDPALIDDYRIEDGVITVTARPHIAR